MREIDLNKEIERIVTFIREKVHGSGFKKVIVGLSGGIDSALTTALCVKALGSDQVIGVMLPYKTSHSDSLYHATLVAETFEIGSQVIPITPMVDAYFEEYENDAKSLRRGNMMARARMCVLYDLSAKYEALVAGTSNKSELYAGYFTQFGDGACAFEPIGHLFKTEVKAMSEILKVPSEIIKKKPTADLWNGQTDEDEMGITYSLLDEILFQLIDLKKTEEEIHKSGISKTAIENVVKKMKQCAYKRALPDMID